MESFQNLILLYLRPEIPLIVVGLWVCIYVNKDPDLDEHVVSKLLFAIAAVPLSAVLIGAFYMGAMWLSSLLAFVGAVIGAGPFDALEEGISARLAGEWSSWIAAITPWVALVLGKPQRKSREGKESEDV